MDQTSAETSDWQDSSSANEGSPHFDDLESFLKLDSAKEAATHEGEQETHRAGVADELAKEEEEDTSEPSSAPPDTPETAVSMLTANADEAEAPLLLGPPDGCAEDLQHEQYKELSEILLRKAAGNFRNRLIHKLGQEGVLLPRAKRKSNPTVIIFDWDDTLLCTSYLNWSGRHNRGDVEFSRMKEVGNAAAELLELAKSLGHTFIITNSASLWVERTADAYIPSIIPALEDVRIISARSKFEKHYPRHVWQWKYQTFAGLIERLGLDEVLNLVVIGDSPFELEAAQAVAQRFPQIRLKTLKFENNPTPEDLLEELRASHRELRSIVARSTDVEAVIERNSLAEVFFAYTEEKQETNQEKPLRIREPPRVRGGTADDCFSLGGG